MPSKISYINQKTNSARPISYVIENPIDVLTGVVENHRIFQYGDIKLPIDNEMNIAGDIEHDYGLIIKPARAPSGTMIVRRLTGLDLKVEQTGLTEPRTIEGMSHAFGKAIDGSMMELLDEHGTMGCYLDAYHIRKEENSLIPSYERRMHQLFDICNAAFRIENPTILDLKTFLKAYARR